MKKKVYFFDSHPVQYKAPVYQELQNIYPDSFEVIYASDFSVRGGIVDKGFGEEVKWDTPLLTGYAYRVLGNESGTPLSGARSLTGKGVFSLLKRERPAAIVLTHTRYSFDRVAYISAVLLNIPILIRQETQDEMFAQGRSDIKRLIRYLAYRFMYMPVRHAFAFGFLNYQHLTKHGIPAKNISFAHFSVPDPISKMSLEERERVRGDMRKNLNVSPEKIIVSFFGKFIKKKDPALLYRALEYVPESIRGNMYFLFVGAGELHAELNKLADNGRKIWGVETHFAGFVNQTKLPQLYLTADMLVLPSRRMGEAWGLVVNEALQAGCSVVVSDAVGCCKEFEDMDRVRVIPVDGARELAKELVQLSALSRDFTWAKYRMEEYSSVAAAQALRQTISKYATE